MRPHPRAGLAQSSPLHQDKENGGRTVVVVRMILGECTGLLRHGLSDALHHTLCLRTITCAIG
eukprot:6756706-Pyramimonas_sp.AAC.1